MTATETMSVEAELLAATGQKKKLRKETPEDYRARLVQAVNELDDDGWKGLSTDAQSWCNEATEALKAKEDVPAFPGEQAEAAPAKGKRAERAQPEAEAELDDDEDDEDDDEQEAPEQEAPKAARKAARATGRKVTPRDSDRKRGGVRVLKEQILKHPSWPLDKLMEKVEGTGFALARGTTTMVYYDTLNTLRMLKERGHLADMTIPERRRGRKASDKPAKPARKAGKIAKGDRPKRAKKV